VGQITIGSPSDSEYLVLSLEISSIHFSNLHFSWCSYLISFFLLVFPYSLTTNPPNSLTDVSTLFVFPSALTQGKTLQYNPHLFKFKNYVSDIISYLCYIRFTFSLLDHLHKHKWHEYIYIHICIYIPKMPPEIVRINKFSKAIGHKIHIQNSEAKLLRKKWRKKCHLQ
jgi:hypothetical protein